MIQAALVQRVLSKNRIDGLCADLYRLAVRGRRVRWSDPFSTQLLWPFQAPCRADLPRSKVLLGATL